MEVAALSGCRLRLRGSRLRLRGEEGEMMWVRGDRLHSPVSNFLNLKFLNFRGIRSGRKFAVSLPLGLTD
jgi:hypothetical protein